MYQNNPKKVLWKQEQRKSLNNNNLRANGITGWENNGHSPDSQDISQILGLKQSQQQMSSTFNIRRRLGTADNL
jgi:hypothetical protein